MAKGGSDEQKREVNLYYISMLMAFCRGEIDEIREIMAGDYKTVWKGGAGSVDYAQFPVNLVNLFGGYEQEGGLVGWITAMFGRPTQKMLAPLCTKFGLGLTPDTTEAYRSMFTLFIHGINYQGGMLVNANSKSLPTFYARLGRFPKQLPQDVARIPCPVDRTSDDVQNLFPNSKIPWLGNLQQYVPKVINAKTGQVETIVVEYQDDANPAHVIYDMMVRVAGYNPALIDTQSFIDAANKLYIGEILVEGQPDRIRFGITHFWSQQSRVFDEINKILNIISATLFPHPLTGLYTLKLIRGDYNTEDGSLLRLDDTNSTITTFRRAGWSEIINCVKVTYTNPKNAKEETIVAMNSAAIATQGAIIQDTRDYAGIGNPDLAAYCGMREVQNSQASETAEVECFGGVGWDQVPGGVILLNSTNPDYEFVDRPFRITSIDYGNSKSGRVVMQVANDTWAEPGTGYIDPSKGSEMQPIFEYPKPAAASLAFTTPAFFVSRVAQLAQLDPAGTYCIVLAAQVGIYTVDYELLTAISDGYESIGRYNLASTGFLGQELVREVGTVMPSFPGIIGDGPSVGGYVIIGDDEATQEIARVDAISAAGYALSRGLFDTVPRARPSGTRVWFVDGDTDTFDRRLRAVGTTASYKVLPRTAADTLDPVYAPVVATPASDRPHQPLRPANCRVEGVAFGLVTVIPSPDDTTISVSWSNRNRITEDVTANLWSDGNTAPEAGQTTTLVVIDRDTGAEVKRYSGLTGAAYDIPLSDLGDVGRAQIQFSSERDGLTSLQFFGINVEIIRGGWGRSWGYNWGG